MTTPNEAAAREVLAEAVEPCPTCHGEGKVEHPHLTAYTHSHAESPADPIMVPCEDCNGAGEITAEDHDTFKSDHGIDVYFRGRRRIVFFDYEGDGVFVWAFPGESVCLGADVTDTERDSISEQLWAWYLDWTASSPEDDRCE